MLRPEIFTRATDWPSPASAYPNWEGGPPKKSGAKNVQNFGRFYTTSDFDREYLRNGSRYLKSESNFSRSIPSAFYEKGLVNFGPLVAEN